MFNISYFSILPQLSVFVCCSLRLSLSLSCMYKISDNPVYVLWCFFYSSFQKLEILKTNDKDLFCNGPAWN